MHDNWQESFARWLIYMSPYVRIGDFILGCLTAQIYMVAHKEDLPLAVLGLASISIGGAVLIGFDRENFVLAPIIPPVMLCVVCWNTRLSAILSRAPIIRLGDSSYSIYLIHYIVLLAMVRLAPTHPILALAAALAITLALSLFLYTKYEAPMRRWIGGRKLMPDGTSEWPTSAQNINSSAR
jgi:peptidoglycan/LPS O-acetylase OafA/YrhL